MDKQKSVQLSVVCRKCGATNKFFSDNIPAFCAFCASVLPDMTEYVNKALDLALERERHEMQMALAEKELKKEEARRKSQKYKMIDNTFTILMILGIIALIAFFYVWLIKKTTHS